jgi:hypothetical protein
MAMAFAELRKRHELSKADLLRLLQRQPGLEQLNWTTYRGWASGATEPKPAYLLALRSALDMIRKGLSKDGKKK